MTDLDPLFANHLAFLGAHRGTVRITQDEVRVEGRAPFLSSWTPLGLKAKLPASTTAVRLIPESGDGWAARLSDVGYVAAESLIYMELPAGEPLRPVPSPAAGADIARAASEAEARAFAKVQAAAFLDPVDPHFAWWVRCFDDMAVANYGRDGQSFLFARRQGAAASVLLSVQTGVTGIYAVATAPPFQRMGLSTALLRHVRKASDGPIILQAILGSYANGFYARLGFIERYRSQIWRHPAMETS